MMPVYVFSGGDVATSVFNAIATLTNGTAATFASAMTIAGIFSVAGAALAYTRSRDLSTLAKWFAIYFSISFVALGLKANLQVIETPNPMLNNTVANVPLGIALPASEATSVSYGLTRAFDAIFHMPDDMNYTDSGMLFGSKQILMSNTAEIRDTQTRLLFSKYFFRCMVPDVTINRKYTWGDLMTTGDIVGFLDGVSQSPLRGLYDGSGKFLSCAQAWTRLRNDLADEARNSVLPAIASRLFGDALTTAQASQKLQTSLPAGYKYFTGISSTATAILEQNMAINAVRNATQNYGATVGATAALENYQSTLQENQRMLASENLAAQASYYLPMLQTVLFLLLCACFPLIMILAMQPYFGIRIILNYLAGFVYLASWPILFSVLNYIMTSALYYGTKNEAQHGFTLSNVSQIAYMHSQFAAVAGYLELAIPVLSMMLVRGVASVLAQASQYFFGMSHSMAAGIAGETAHGNLALGNANMGNQSWNNVSANKHDVNYTDMHGMTTVQADSGATVTHTASGASVVNTAGAISHLPVNVALSSGVSASLNRSSEHALSHARQESVNFNAAVTSAANQVQSFSQSSGNTQTLGSGMSQSQNFQAREGAQSMMQVAHDVAQSNHISEQQALQHLMGMQFGGRVSGDISKSFGSSLSPLNGKLGISGNLGIEGRSVSTHDRTAAHNQDIRVSDHQQQQFNDGFDAVKSATATTHFDAAGSSGSSFAASFAADVRNAETASAQIHSDLTAAQRFSSAAQFAQSHSESVGANMTPAFQQYLTRRLGAREAESLMSSSSANDVARMDAYADRFMQTSQGRGMATQFASHGGTLTVRSAAVADRQGVLEKAGGTLAQNDLSNRADMIEQTDTTVWTSRSLGDKLNAAVESAQSGVKSDIDARRTAVEEQQDDIDGQVRQATDKTKNAIQGSFFREVARGAEGIFDHKDGDDDRTTRTEE